jgi:hypothetical protein
VSKIPLHVITDKMTRIHKLESDGACLQETHSLGIMFHGMAVRQTAAASETELLFLALCTLELKRKIRPIH